MLTQEKINKIYDAIINDITLTTEELTNCGFTSEEIYQLIENNIIKKNEDDTYELVSIEHLYNYGLISLSANNITLAIECFYRCTKLEPNYRPPYLHLLYVKIKSKKYTQAYKVFEKIDKIEGTEFQKDNNMYLYLLNLILPCPETYQERIATMSEVDLLSGSESKKEEDEIRTKIFTNNFHLAISALNRLNVHDPAKEIERKIIKKLLSQAINIEQENKQKLLELAKSESYNDIIALLEAKSKKKTYKQTDKYTLFLAKAIQNIISSKEIPSSTVSYARNVFEAIEGNNFKLALQLQKRYTQKYKMNEETALYILLVKINELIFEIESSRINLSDIIEELRKNKIENAIDMVKKYLEYINKTEYEFLIINLIKLSVIEGDISFIKPISILKEIEQNKYIFNLPDYLKIFYLYISQSKLQEARIYADIILKYYKGSKQVIDNIVRTLDEAEQNQLLLQNKEKDYERELVLNATNQMEQNEEVIAILGQFPREQRGKIEDLINGIDGFKWFTVGTEPKTLVLRRVNSEQEKININELRDEFYLAHKQKRYQTCINIMNTLLQSLDYNPSASHRTIEMFEKVGIIYLRNGNTKEAIKYLTLVTEKQKTNQDPKYKRYDYTDLIFRINNQIFLYGANYKKKNPQVLITEFESTDEANNGTKDIEDIAYFICEEKISLEHAIEQYNLTEEQVQLIKLIYARDYFIEGAYPQGDKLLQEVEKSKNKTKRIIDLLKEIRSRRLFYKNRPDALERVRKQRNKNPKQLPTPKPNN